MKLSVVFHRPIGKICSLRLAVIITTCVFLSGCASIVSKTNWPVSIDSKPEGVHVSITNKSGKEVFSGKTPAVTKLKSGSGFFSKESYTVVLTYKGIEKRTINLECTINGWYFGNILFGGLIGMLIIDPATGAMYRLEKKDIYEVFKEDKTSQLNILDINNIPLEWRTSLIEL
jgi:hypothetical protein